MSELTIRNETASVLEQVIITGDLAKLSPADRLAYYLKVCESIAVNPYTRPFQYITLNGKLTLYATRDCTDQLRHSRRVSAAIVNRERIDDVYVVTARATLPDGRQDESIGAVTIGNLKGDALANALMKAETKAKRRVTLSIVGLGWLDETEIETIRDAKPATVIAEYPKLTPSEDEAEPEAEPEPMPKNSYEVWRDKIKATKDVPELLAVGREIASAKIADLTLRPFNDALTEDYKRQKHWLTMVVPQVPQAEEN